jgi:hypothetical protein
LAMYRKWISMILVFFFLLLCVLKFHFSRWILVWYGEMTMLLNTIASVFY